MGRPKKSETTPTINSLLTLQIALSGEFAKRKLPQLTVTSVGNAIYLTGPCGQQLCKVLYVGAAKITATDYAVIFNHTVNFVDKHLKTLKKLFVLRQTIKAAKEQELKIPAPLKVSFGTDANGRYVHFGTSHIAYSKFIVRTYENAWVSTNLLVKDKDMVKLADHLENKLAQQREFLKENSAITKMEAEANKIIADLSACSI